MAVVCLAAAAAAAAVVVVAVLGAPLLDHLPRNDNDDNVVVVQTFHPSVLVALLDGKVLPPSFLLPVPHDLLVVAIGFVDLALFQSALVSSDVDDAQLLLVHLAAGLLLLLVMLVGLEMASPCREMMFEAYY